MNTTSHVRRPTLSALLSVFAISLLPLSACERDDSRPKINKGSTNTDSSVDGIARSNSIDTGTTPATSPSTSGSAPASSTPTTAASTIQPDLRILSILHAKNEEEIRLGQLAIDHGASDAVKQYGQMLVRDHSASDTRVHAVAAQAGLALLDPAQVKEMLAREKGQASPPAPVPDPLAELRALSSSAFDQRFMDLMSTGHREAITLVETALPSVTREDVRALLTETLPVLLHHAEMASPPPTNPTPGGTPDSPTSPHSPSHSGTTGGSGGG